MLDNPSGTGTNALEHLYRLLTEHLWEKELNLCHKPVYKAGESNHSVSIKQEF